MKKERRQHLTGMGILLLLVIVVLIALFGFRVRKVTVVGNSHHSSEEIANDLMTNFLSKNTLYLMWTYKGGEIPSSMPYLDSLKISMKSPFSISVQVKEKPLAGYLIDGDYIYFDEDGVVLEITDKEYSDLGLTLVSGISLGEVNLYQKVPTKSSSQLRTLLNLMDLLTYYDLQAQEIRFGVNSEITVTIRNIDCIFGQDEYMEEKAANLNAVLKNISKSTTGALHLENVTGKYEDITFTPTGTVTEEPETQESTGEESFEETGSSGSSDEATLVGATTDGSAAVGGVSADEQEQEAAEEAGYEEADREEEEYAGEEDKEEDDGEEDSAAADFMVFNSSGQLVYNVRVQDGQVVDSSGNEVPGCYVDEDGYVVDAYMNIIDPESGELMN